MFKTVDKNICNQTYRELYKWITYEGCGTKGFTELLYKHYWGHMSHLQQNCFEIQRVIRPR